MILKNRVFFLMITVAANSLFAANLFSTNSGFETAITPWKLSFQDTAIANAAISQGTDGVKFGTKYCRINVTKVDADSVGNNWYIQLWEPTWTAGKDVKYTYSCWAKSGDANSHLIHIAATGDSASEYTYQDGTSFTLSTEWQKCEHSYTWTQTGTTKKHFRIFLAGSTGAVCFDSMALDTGLTTIVQEPFAISNRNETFNYGVQLLPSCLRIVLGNSPPVSNTVAIYSVGGRLLSSQKIPAATSTFAIPKPSSGAWVVDVNSNKKVIRIP
ncbi:MAG: carbohydrate binding domain-containing protein [Chitinispirillaceae bacterium]|nr:carbohydrate binding domain-containing protein [Chitinispirillaceae bacterium]